MADITEQFLEKFKKDPRFMNDKLKSIGLAKNTYLSLKYKRMVPRKKTLETIRAYLENRRPKFEAVDPKVNFYCCDCEQIKPLKEQLDRWFCRRCTNKSKYLSRKRHWTKVLAYRREYKLKKSYGEFAPCMRTILEIKKEIRNNG